MNFLVSHGFSHDQYTFPTNSITKLYSISLVPKVCAAAHWCAMRQVQVCHGDFVKTHIHYY